MQVKEKIQDRDTAARICASWRVYGNKIVFTNGCFDLVHPGHLQYLQEARALGHRLVVGVNSDESVQKLKGASRPIMDHQARTILLASLLYVDLVVVFSEDTPLKLIQTLQPNVLVKGGDYKIVDIVGAKEILEWGGETKVLSFLPGYSSSDIINKIKASA